MSRVIEITRYHEYHPPFLFGDNSSCTICGNPLGHSITLMVRFEDDEAEVEIHADCAEDSSAERPHTTSA